MASLSVQADAPTFKHKLKVLVVDDMALNRRIVGAMLKGLGVESQEAENGKQAVDLFLAGSTFDLVLMDLEMPVMNGIEATKNLRSIGVTAKIVAVSANTTDSDKQVFLDAGAEAYYVKPMTRSILLSILQEVDNKLDRITPEGEGPIYI